MEGSYWICYPKNHFAYGFGGKSGTLKRILDGVVEEKGDCKIWKYRRQLETSQGALKTKNRGIRWDKVTMTYQWIIRLDEKGWKNESEYKSSQCGVTSAKTVAEAGRDCVTRAAYTPWWKWDAGSRPFFWRFPEEFRMDMMEGIKRISHHT